MRIMKHGLFRETKEVNVNIREALLAFLSMHLTQLSIEPLPWMYVSIEKFIKKLILFKYLVQNKLTCVLGTKMKGKKKKERKGQLKASNQKVICIDMNVVQCRRTQKEYRSSPWGKITLKKAHKLTWKDTRITGKEVVAALR